MSALLPPSSLAVPEALQQPVWPDPEALRTVRERLRTALPLVLPTECDVLRRRLAAVAAGKAFVLQGGDCAETFRDLSLGTVSRKMDTLFGTADELSEAMFLPVVVVARLAGQYAKPRSQPVETRDGVTLPSYRGDAVNGPEFTAEARTPDPHRMLQVYAAAGATLNAVRSLLTERRTALGQREMFVSHEALLLDYERPLTRPDARTGDSYAGSGHLLWVGERTRQTDGAHIEYLSRIRNPVAVKVGPTATPAEVLALVERLDPDREPGRLTLVARMGADRVRDALPPLVESVAAAGGQVVWICDPMHGNTYNAPSGHKTRHFDAVLDEVTGFFEVHRSLGTHAGGLHLEMTGEEVTECVGAGVAPADLPLRYETACDPRLNRSQTLELARLVGELATPVAG
ncbi:phospho-2-dehydro-3-deoxyheptonate aldolase [Streptomyces sp. Y2F8-2]|uniref:3-deoxy-7-phosphoheptulonate synthase n=1 Tax=Streptomyces sp. Y2F8-2 TaxID=2759675 RepID=UPI001906B858|nr:3-deoxy-7-phosphoheptulonate synthase class II [Streptomyces sp. Y2F8-2]GHJ98971.1 phospho-2-dehydro-3-deoxyheptonate aldolase [Streptomyces sp. Y2F8-2]